MYNAASYWDTIAQKISGRDKNNFIAGDEEPYYNYKREKFLQMLHRIHFKGKHVLEIGTGPGGNLLEIFSHNPARLTGVDISGEMLALAATNTAKLNIELIKTDGEHLPFADNSFDISITATVLQHVVDENVLSGLIKEMCRVTTSDIYLFERIESVHKPSPTNTGRTVDEYRSFFNVHGFALEEVDYAWLHISYLASGAIRKLFNGSKRGEADKPSSFSVGMQKLTLPITRQLDKVFKKKRDLAMLHFKKTVV